jgi:hypothetical protein
MVVAVTFTDLQERTPGNLPALLVKLVQHGEHRASPSVAGVQIRAEAQASPPRFFARRPEQALDPLQPSFDLKSAHVASLGVVWRRSERMTEVVASRKKPAMPASGMRDSVSHRGSAFTERSHRGTRP